MRYMIQTADRSGNRPEKMIDKKTKIICTMGPASDSEEVLRKMVEGGMNVARLNFSHGTHESHGKTIDMIKKVREEMGVPLPILLDTKGPEYRIGTFEKGSILLEEGDPFTFCCEETAGTVEKVSVSYKKLSEELQPGDTILVNDGLVSLRVEAIAGTEIHCVTLIGGKLSDRKSMSFPGKVLKQTYLSEQDKADLLFGIEKDVDFVACSFVSCARDILDVREFLDANGGSKIQLMAKIENQSGVDNAEDILRYCEALMVARGDLGVEVPYQELPAIQKHLIKLCNRMGAVCITATEMLESMIEKPRPTRAEISDVANAVFDGSSAIMLSGETASGKYPVQAVSAMAMIAKNAEEHIDYAKRFRSADIVIDDLTDAMSHSASQLALDTDARCIISRTAEGFTARMISRCRVPMPIIGMTSREKTYRQLDLCWNVKPVLVKSFTGLEEMIHDSVAAAKEYGFVQSGDLVVLTGGLSNRSGGTKFIHADTVE